MEFTGKTVAEAIEKGLTELGIAEEKAEVKIIEEPTKGLFGRLKGKAVVEITEKLNDLERAADFLQKILDLMDINAKVNVKEEEEKKVLDLITDKSSAVIGYRGEVLDAMQTLAGAMANLGNEEYKKVSVDCEGYREKREETLIALAHKLEDKATEMRREVQLEPMSPFERRIIHTALADSKTVTTKSDGKEPNRFVVIVPFDLDENSTPYNAGRNRDQGRRDRNSRGRREQGDRRNDRRNSGRRPASSGSKSSKSSISSFSFGTYLGNSLKDKE